MGAKDRVVKYVKSITIEPTIFLFMLGQMLIDGAQLNTNLLIEKVCKHEFHHNGTICDNLDLDEYDDIETTGR